MPTTLERLKSVTSRRDESASYRQKLITFVTGVVVRVRVRMLNTHVNPIAVQSRAEAMQRAELHR